MTQEAAIHVSNVMLVDPETKKRTRVGLPREDRRRATAASAPSGCAFAKRSGKDI